MPRKYEHRTTGEIQRILDMHFQQGKTYGEIALAIGATRQAVSGVIFRHRTDREAK